MPPSLKNGLNSLQIENMLKDINNYGGVYSKDQIPKNLKKNYWYVVNMQNEKDGNGTHWVCFKYNSTIIYWDSFGFPPPKEIMKLSKKGLLYSTKEIQNIKSTSCGWFCIAIIRLDALDNDKLTPKAHYQKIINKFSDDSTENEQLLYNILKQVGVQ
jgi:hypothetical protein